MPHVYAYVAAKARSIGDAEDVTEDVYLSALKGIAGLRASDSLGVLAWLFQIARNKLADLYRSPPADAPDLWTGDLPGEELLLSPLDLLELRNHREYVRSALTELSRDQNDVLTLLFFLDYDAAQTAALIGQSTDDVDRLEHRGLAALRRALARVDART